MPPRGGDPIPVPVPDTQLRAACSSYSQGVWALPAPPEPALVAGTMPPRLWGSCGAGLVANTTLLRGSGRTVPEPRDTVLLGSGQAFASLVWCCLACSLWLTTSHALPEAEPRDLAATPSPFLSPSHNPASSAGPDATAQSAGIVPGAITAPVKQAPWAHQPRTHLGSVLGLPLPVPALDQTRPPGGFFPSENDCGVGMGLLDVRFPVGWSRSTGWACRQLPDSLWHRFCIQAAGPVHKHPCLCWGAPSCAPAQGQILR